MFFAITLLCPQQKGIFATVWIAATRGTNKLTRKQIMDVNISKICDNIADMYVIQSQKPKERLSLSLSAKLINGTIKIFHKQTLFLQESLSTFLTIPCTIFLKPPPLPKKKTRKPTAVHSDDIVSSNEIVPRVQASQQQQVLLELNISDKDVEQALMQMPIAPLDSITLREEIPTRSVLMDEENLFGDEGFIETELFLLEHGPPLTEKDMTAFEERLLRDESRTEQQVEAPMPILPEIAPPPPNIDIEAITETEATVQEIPKKTPKKKREEPLPSTAAEPEDLEAVRVVQDEEEPPSKRRKSERTATQGIVQEQQEQIVGEGDVTPTRQPAARELFPEVESSPVIRPVDFKKMLVKLTSRFKKIKYRCEDEDLELFVEAIYTPSLDRFEYILEECQEIIVRGPQEISFEAGRGHDSTGTRTTGSLTRLARRTSEDTPTAIPIRRDVSELIPEEEIARRESSIEKTCVRPKRKLLARRSGTPEVEVPKFPAGPSTPLATPVLQEKEVSTALETIVEDLASAQLITTIEEELPPAAAAAIQPTARVVLQPVSPKTKQVESGKKLTDENTRQRQIVRIVKDWDFETNILTIEDVAQKPLNRLNMAMAFRDLLSLHRSQYVTLKRKEGSIVLERIEKGTKLQ